MEISNTVLWRGDFVFRKSANGNGACTTSDTKRNGAFDSDVIPVHRMTNGSRGQ